MYSHSCLCAEMPLPTLAVPALQKPIGSMLTMRGFMREKEGKAKRKRKPSWDGGAETTRLQFDSVSERSTSSDQHLKDDESDTIDRFFLN